MEHSNNVAISVAKNYSSLSRIFRSLALSSGLLPALDLGWTMCIFHDFVAWRAIPSSLIGPREACDFFPSFPFPIPAPRSWIPPSPTHLHRGLAASLQKWPSPPPVIASQGLYGESQASFNSGNRIQLVDAAASPYVNAAAAVYDAVFHR
jgi:hypothetical protein